MSLKEITITDYTLPNEKKQTFFLTYQVFGQPLHQAPVILVNHALTGNSKVSGPNGWWKNLVGQHQIIDLNRYSVIVFDIPGNGFNKNKDHLIANYKELTTKIIADLFWKALEKLKIQRLYAIIGGSLGGGIAWEMAFLKPNITKHLIPIATHLRASDWLIGNVFVQDSILSNSNYPVEEARMHAMLLYRTPASLQLKFNRQYQTAENQYTVESWLKYHGKALNNRFSLSSYKLMNHLLKTIGEHLKEEDIICFAKNNRTQIHIIAVNTDYMFTQAEQKQTFKLIKKYNSYITYGEIESIHGHDAFLIEYNQLNNLLKNIF